MARVVVYDNRVQLVKNRTTDKVGDWAQAILRDARGLTPVRTGRLITSAYVERDRRGRYLIGYRAPYAGYVELGTRYMRGQHFLRRACYRKRA